MRKFLLFGISFLMFCRCLVAQDSTAFPKRGLSNLYGSAALITIKGDEIRRFPTNNFLDAINGLFPWVFSLTPNSNEFLFVINGFLLTDVNSLSLNDIAEVSFTRNKLNGSLYPFSRAGTFYITTRTTTEGKPLFSLSSQYNAVWDKNGSVSAFQPPPNVIVDELKKNKAGHLFRTHASILTSGKNWNLHISAQLDDLIDPTTSKKVNVTFPNTNQKDSSTFNGSRSQMNIRSFAQFTYRLTDNLHVGISGSYFHGKTNRDSSLIQQSFGQTYNMANDGIAALPYYNGGAFFDWTPSKNLHNRASVEYTNEKLDDNSNTSIHFLNTQNELIQRNITTESVARDKLLLVRNELTYSITTSSKFRSGISTIFSFFNQKPEYKSTSVTSERGLIISSSGNTMQSAQKLTSLNVNFFFSYNQVLSGYAGYALLLNEGISRFTSKSRSNPYAGVELNIKHMLKEGHKIDRLDLSVNYGDLGRNNSNNYMLTEVLNSMQLIPTPVISNYGFTGFFSPVFPNASLGNAILKNKLISVQANTAFMNSKLLAGAEWSRLDLENLYAISIAIGPNNPGYVFVKGIETRRGVSAFMAAKLFDQPAKKWMVRFNTLIPRYQTKLDAGNYPIVKGINDQFQAGVQNNITLNKWFIQVNGLMAFNKEVVNSFMMNYLLAGYEFAGTKNSKQKMSVFAQARNLLATGFLKDQYRYYSYVGGGVQVVF